MLKQVVRIVVVAVAVLTGLASCGGPDGEIMKREGDGYVINTTKLSREVIGYEGATPVKIYITAGKVTKVEALPNIETPRYFARVKTHLLPQWNGLTVSQALKADVDGVSGSTYSARAVKENVRLGLEYYKRYAK